MLYSSESDSHVNIVCKNCGKLLKISKSQLIQAEKSYYAKQTIQCSCGNTTNAISGNKQNSYDFLQLETASVTIESSEPKNVTRASSAKGKGAVSGCLSGWMMGGCSIAVGSILCITGIGAIIGIPLILAGFLVAIIGPMMGLTALKGACPWCGTNVTSYSGGAGFNCHACKKRIVIKDKHFLKIE